MKRLIENNYIRSTRFTNSTKAIFLVKHIKRHESEVLNMAKYYISYNDYFGYCVIEEIDGSGIIVFTGSIEDCNKKCIELNGGTAL